MVTVIYGANSSDLEGFEGQTVAAARAAFASVYGIPADAQASLNGSRAQESDVLRGEDELSFVKATAQKGS